jgi:hypothetical protein
MMIGKDMKGCNVGLIKVSSWYSPGGHEGKHEKSQNSGILPRFEQGIS